MAGRKDSFTRVDNDSRFPTVMLDIPVSLRHIEFSAATVDPPAEQTQHLDDIEPNNTGVQHDYIYNAEFATLTDAEMVDQHGNEEIVALDGTLAGSRTTKGMPVYLLRLCEAKLLTPADERDLFRRMNFAKYRAAQLRERMLVAKPTKSQVRNHATMQSVGLSLRNRIVRANLRLVVSIAKKFADLKNPFEELLSEGISSLIRAVDKFDYDRGFRFSTYATQAVRRTLYRLVNQRQLDRNRFVPTEIVQLEGRSDDESASTMTEARWDHLQLTLTHLLAQLDERERLIIRHRFGLDEEREVKTLQSLAKQLGVCKERVRQLEQRAITKLRLMADEVELCVPED